MFPNIGYASRPLKLQILKLYRWNAIRATEGWSALQHHAVLHTELVLTPPPDSDSTATPPRFLVADVRQASFFALIPATVPANYTPSWHNGNIYNLANSPTHVVELPDPPALHQPTTFHLIVSGDYEIRLFGDPMDLNDQETPVQRLHIDLGFEEVRDAMVVVESKLNVVPDIVDGWMLSENGSIGVGIRSLEGWWEATSVESASEVCTFLVLVVIYTQPRNRA
jgi:hypothetical protein